MKISVIIPAHNEERYIAKALEALLAQDYPDYEVIVIDNASTDKTREIAGQFPVKVVSESRKGTMWACERGRQEATGGIIVRMDADCVPGKHWLSHGATFFSNPKVVAATGPYHYIDGGFSFRIISLYVQKVLYWLTHQILHVGAKRAAILIGGNSFMRASALAQVGGFNTAITFYGDDTDTAKRLARVGRIIFSPRLVLDSSARRFHHEGVPHILWQYFKGFFLHSFLK